MALTDQQIANGLEAVIAKLRTAVQHEISNRRPGELAEGLSMVMAMASIDVDTFKRGARI